MFIRLGLEFLAYQNYFLGTAMTVHRELGMSTVINSSCHSGNTGIIGRFKSHHCITLFHCYNALSFFTVLFTRTKKS